MSAAEAQAYGVIDAILPAADPAPAAQPARRCGRAFT
jgi:hypothetical protein